MASIIIAYVSENDIYLLQNLTTVQYDIILETALVLCSVNCERCLLKLLSNQQNCIPPSEVILTLPYLFRCQRRMLQDLNVVSVEYWCPTLHDIVFT